MSINESELLKELSLLQTDSDDEEGDWRKSNSLWTDSILQNSVSGVHKLKNSGHNTEQNANCQKLDKCKKLRAEQQLKVDDFLNNLQPAYPSNTSRDVSPSTLTTMNTKHNIAVPPPPLKSPSLPLHHLHLQCLQWIIKILTGCLLSCYHYSSTIHAANCLLCGQWTLIFVISLLLI
jgi:hypothetical protein